MGGDFFCSKKIDLNADFQQGSFSDTQEES